jgi:hypothetical protein
VDHLAPHPLTEEILLSDQKPSVGRIVHYVSYGTPGGEYKSQCRAAIITEFNGESSGEDGELVGLCVMNPEGLFLNRGVIHSEHPDAHLGGTWHWPERV